MQIKGVGRRQVRKLHTAYHRHIPGSPCVTSALTQGLGMPQDNPPKPSHESMVEMMQEYMQLVLDMRRLLQRFERSQRAAVTPPAEAARMGREARSLSASFRYGYRAWQARGHWVAFLQVPNGSVHTNFGCRTIHYRHTQLRALYHLLGQSVEEAVTQGYKMCAHCQTRPHDRLIARVDQFVNRACADLDAMADTLGE